MPVFVLISAIVSPLPKLQFNKSAMSRRITERFRVEGLMIAETPLHIGGLEGDINVDLALAIDGQGRYYIPGTSLAGAFRAWMQQTFDDAQIIDRLWGHQEIASFVMIEDALITHPASVEIREGVRIDRQSGTAADRAKYNRAILPKGSTFPLRLTLEVVGSIPEAQEQIEALLDALCEGQIRMGAAKTRGLGKVKLIEAKITKESLASKANLLQVLKGENTSQNYTPKPAKIAPQLTIEIVWSPVGAVMVKAEQDGIAVDMLPFASSVDQAMALTIPGSSIKGSLRFQAERIIRTVKSQASKAQVLEQVEVPIVQWLFGSASRSNNQHKNLGLSALTVDDCYSQIRLQPDEWEKITSAKDSATLVQALKPLGETQQAFHVAVDRWTGGAADAMLYSNLEPFGINWEPIYLTLQLNRLSNQLAEQSVAIVLLLLTLRDLMAGRIPIGYGANRGLGAIQVEEVRIEGKSLPEPFQSLNNKAVLKPESELQELDQSLLLELEKRWQAWIDSTTEETV